MVNYSAAALEQGFSRHEDEATQAIFDSGPLYRDHERIVAGRFEKGKDDLVGLRCGVLDLTGFDQPANGRFRETVGFPGFAIFGDKTTVENKLNQYVVSRFSQKEKEAYDAEEKARDKYNEEWIRRATTLVFKNPAPWPEVPKLPMHEEAERRVEDLKKRITEQVRSEMSPEHLARLDKEARDYEVEYLKQSSKWNPVGTGDWHIHPLPKTPEIVKDYYNRIRKAVLAL